MTLLNQYAKTFTVLTRVTAPDGLGGYKNTWTTGRTLSGALAPTSERDIKAADVKNIKVNYVLLVDKAEELPADTVLTCGDDVYIVVSALDYHTPDMSSLNLRKVLLSDYTLETEAE